MSKIRKTVLVYDNLASPPTYGDLLYVILLSKFLILSGYKLKFYIVDSEFRDDWYDLNQQEINSFLEEQLLFCRELLNFNGVKIERISWQILKNDIIKDNKNVLFIEHVINRQNIYSGCFNLLNKLLSEKNQYFIDNFLFDYKNFYELHKTKPILSNYLSIGCRFSEKWGFDRNLTEDEFCQIYQVLSKAFPNQKKLIISDVVGCNYFRDIAVKNGFDVLFSKDYSDTILGDATLILGSDFFYQLKGGGISIFPIFSKIPYHITQPLVHESMWSTNKLTSFQSENQHFFNLS